MFCIRKFIKKIIVILLICCTGTQIILAENLKIGVVNTSFILENAPQSARFREKLTLEFAAKERELNNNRAKLRELQVQLDQAKTPAESDGIINKINRLDRETARLADDFRQDYTLRINEELLKVQKDIGDEIVKYAEEEKFDLILESGVFYVSPKLIVTNEILSRLK